MSITQKLKNIDILKLDMPMIHGHTTIELRSKHGLVERYESDNTFQGSMIANYMKGSDDTPYTTPIFVSQNDAPWKKIVGGLLLFRDAITEGSQFMPAGNRMIGKGCADISNTSNPPELGSYNAVESSGTASALTQVYDFATNQANGQISCVCLTSQEGGLVGYGNASGTQYSSLAYFGQKYGSIGDANIPITGQLADDGCRYTFSKTSDTLTVTKTKTCGITLGSALAGLSNTYTHDISAFQTIYKNNAWRCFYCGNNIFRFLPRDEYTIAAGGTIYYVEYNADTNTLTEKSFTNIETTPVTTGTSSYNDRSGGFTNDGKLIAATGSSGQYHVVIIDLETSVGVVDYISPNTAQSVDVSPVYINNGLYLVYDGTLKMVDITNATEYPVDSSYAYTRGYAPNGKLQGWLVSGSNQRTKIWSNPLYLATINNLETPVTKDASKTMKVTYTLTEV